MRMLKKYFACVCSLALAAEALSGTVCALDTVILPVEEGITLVDVTGAMYVHADSSCNIRAAVDKTEPEGIFRYYDADISPASSGAVYRMDLSRCEYLVGSGEYASRYTVSFTAGGDEASFYSQDIIVRDPDFADTDSCEFHFYVSTEPGESSCCNISGSNEYVSDSGVLVYELYLDFRYKSSEKTKGDVDGDGAVTLTDAALVLTHYASTSAGLGSDVDKEAADVDGDGRVQLSDASAILMYYAMSAASMDPQWDEILG